MEVKLKFDSWDRIVSSVCIQSMNIPLSIIVCCSPIVLCRLFSIISCFRTINHLWYIYIYIKEKKRNIIKKQRGKWNEICIFQSLLFFFIRNYFILSDVQQFLMSLVFLWSLNYIFFYLSFFFLPFFYQIDIESIK